MATIPVQRTWATGEVVTAAMLNDDVRDAINFLLNQPAVQVTNSANQTFANNTITALTFNAESFDTDSMHSTASNTSRLTCVTPGLYRVSGSATFAANATGRRDGWLRLNGSTFVDEDRRATLAGGGETTPVKVFTTIRLAAGDYVEMLVRQTSGGNLDSLTQTTSPHLEMEWITA